MDGGLLECIDPEIQYRRVRRFRFIGRPVYFAVSLRAPTQIDYYITLGLVPQCIMCIGPSRVLLLHKIEEIGDPLLGYLALGKTGFHTS